MSNGKEPSKKDDHGASSSTKIKGTSNDDVLSGTPGNDKISGRAGNDTINGGAGNDKIEGGKGNDTINGDAGNDHIHGGSGDDVLAGGAGNDKVEGGKGNDVLIYDAALNVGAHDVYDGGSGTDTLRLVLTAEQANDPAIQAEIAAFQAFLANGGHGHGNDHGHGDDHGHDDGPDGAFVFHTLGLTVKNIETLDVVVPNSNAAPVAADDAFATDEDTALNVTAAQLVANDSDVDGDTVSVTGVSNAVNGTVSLDLLGNIVFTPDADFNGLASFDYTIADGNGGSDTGTVNVTVNAVNDAPVAVDDAVATDEDAGLNGSVAGNDSDVDGDALTFALGTGPANGSLVFNADGSFTYTPDTNFNGADSFTYVANDGTVDSAPATVNITVNAVNDTPVAADDAFATDEDTALNVTAA